MVSEQRHEMQLETVHPSGEEEWSCPACGRRMMIIWQPWKKIILEPGDVYAAHGGSKGLLKIGGFRIDLMNADGPPSATEPSTEDPRLEPWVRWLEKMDWDDL